MFIVKHHQRTVAFLGDAQVGQLAIDLADPVAIKTLAEVMIEMHAETVVDRLQRGEARAIHGLPDGDRVRVATLESDEFVLRLLERSRIGFAGGICLLVDSFEFLQRVALQRGAIEVVPVTVENLAELRAPIAEVVVTNYPRAAEFKQPAD